ncbi:hypothetical protein SAMN02910447_02159 [Ruminococcus sp. YE71]|uniref:DUF6434 domain-containing protein n=2 Tax=unclassified Ruminococcus TaxID=2608920 RepID=UPI0008804ECB|nr:MULTISPECIES: DUF6434 domain-containing protein [unclassified Ruminococcus]SDA22152.1 hypothetical protein SAMN02910446_02028 [Ruminococcus sp. YE78]SFW37545.1 hypothetical protein SAMN02910447_02159 [Ruminococcus sp. YE71]
MADRPKLGKGLSAETFREYYYLKDELTAFCRENGLPVSGGKTELTERIAHFLATGEVLSPAPVRAKNRRTDGHELSPDSIIEENIVCSEKHRAFFREQIGRSFSFNVPFQKWLKANAGKTYAEAVEAYHAILAVKKNGGTDIGRQFEYNTYIRDFFADNKGRLLADAITCWKYKKSLKGHNRYEPSDLSALGE